MTLQGAPQLQAKLVRLEKGLPGIAQAVAEASVPDVSDAVRADIGDLSMSGWRRKDGNEIELRGMVDKSVAGEAAIVPYAKTGGQFRVLESGRNAAGGAGGFQGPGINFRTGRTSARARATGRGGSTKGRRYNGRTEGKDTWSDAEKLVRAQFVKRSRTALHRVMSNIFVKG